MLFTNLQFRTFILLRTITSFAHTCLVQLLPTISLEFGSIYGIPDNLKNIYVSIYASTRMALKGHCSLSWFLVKCSENLT